MKKILIFAIIIVVIILIVGILLIWKSDFLLKQTPLNTDPNATTTLMDTNLNATATPYGVPLDQQKYEEELYKANPLNNVLNSPLSKKYINAEMNFSLMLPDKVIVKQGSTWFNYDNTINKITIDLGQTSDSDSIAFDLWIFYSDNKNPARNAIATSIEDYLKDYIAPDVKNREVINYVVIHKNETISPNIIKQEYSYGYWEQEINNKPRFITNSDSCERGQFCYSASHYIRYVYYNSNAKKFVILERKSLLSDEFYKNLITFNEKEALAERIAKTLIFE